VTFGTWIINIGNLRNPYYYFPIIFNVAKKPYSLTRMYYTSLLEKTAMTGDFWYVYNGDHAVNTVALTGNRNLKR
jgi:hypothetical protein